MRQLRVLHLSTSLPVFNETETYHRERRDEVEL